MPTTRELLSLRKHPIAVAFLDAPPPGVPRWSAGPVPSGCTFWLRAMEGETFYTVPADHYECAVGCHTHRIALPPERAKELEDTVRYMVQAGYVAMEEVPGIPVLDATPAVVAYGPVDDAPFAPHLVIVPARPAQAMLVYEAAIKAGAGDALANALGRPGCAVLPLARATDRAALSFGCRGNRIFTGLPDDELYMAVPGPRWAAVSAALGQVLAANQAMTRAYEERRLRVLGA